MKVLLSMFILLSVAGYATSQEHQGAFISFDRELHDYGQISSDEVPDGKISFVIYNKGSQPLVLTNVRACCGTRVNDFTREPIAPADSGYVEVEFRVVPRPHRIRRTVTVQSNAANRQTAILRIQGEVVEPQGDLTLQDQ